MPSTGEVRWSPDGTLWEHIGHLFRVMPNFNSLAVVNTPAEGAFVYLIDEKELAVFIGGQWIPIEGVPPCPEFDLTVDYREGDLVMDPADGEVYRAPVDISANGDLPSDAGSIWEPVSGSALIYQDSTVNIPPNSLGRWYMHPDTREIGAVTPDPNTNAPRWTELLSELLIRTWIAEASLFRGTVQETGGTITGAVTPDLIPDATAANQASYWIAVTDATYTHPAAQGGATVDIHPGDWLMSTGSAYVRIPGGQLTKAIADTLYDPLDSRPRVQYLANAGETPTTVGGGGTQTHRFGHDYEVYHGTIAPVAEQAVLNQATGLWAFHRLGAANVDGTADLNRVKVGDVIRATGNGVNSGQPDQIMEMTVQAVAYNADVWTFTGTMTKTVTLFPAGDYIDGSTCDVEVDEQLTIGAKGKEDDVIVNPIDGHTWTFGRDPAGNLDWRLLPSVDVQIIVSDAAGETPFLPGATVMPAILRSGDQFINTADDMQWLYYRDRAGTFHWRSLASPETVEPTNIPGDDPTAWSGLPPVSGDTYLNVTDNRAWVYDGVGWVEYPSGRGTMTYLGNGPFDANNAVAPSWGMPAGTRPDPSVDEPMPNDVYFDVTNGEGWVLS